MTKQSLYTGIYRIELSYICPSMSPVPKLQSLWTCQPPTKNTTCSTVNHCTTLPSAQGSTCHHLPGALVKQTSTPHMPLLPGTLAWAFPDFLAGMHGGREGWGLEPVLGAAAQRLRPDGLNALCLQHAWRTVSDKKCVL